MRGSRGLLENITSGQSGDCSVYSWGFIYIWEVRTDHGLVRYKEPIGNIPQGILERPINSDQWEISLRSFWGASLLSANRILPGCGAGVGTVPTTVGKGVFSLSANRILPSQRSRCGSRSHVYKKGFFPYQPIGYCQVRGQCDHSPHIFGGFPSIHDKLHQRSWVLLLSYISFYWAV